MNLKIGTVEDFFENTEQGISVCWEYLKDKDLEGYRDEELSFNLDQFYRLYKTVIFKVFENHHSFKYIKTLSDHCFSLILKDVGPNLSDFLEDKMPGRIAAFKNLIKGYSICISMILQIEEKSYLTIILDRMNMDVSRLSSEHEVQSSVYMAMLTLFSMVMPA